MTDVTPEQFTQLLEGDINQQPNPEGYTTPLNPAPARDPNLSDANVFAGGFAGR